MDFNKIEEFIKSKQLKKEVLDILERIKKSNADKEYYNEELKKVNDEEYKKLLLEEINKIENEIGNELQLLQNELSKDEHDNKDCEIEISSGEGGEESCIFVKDIFESYKKYAENEGLSIKIIDIQKSDLGYKSILFQVFGKQAFKKFKFESGNHQVMRIPKTAKGDKMHTSSIKVSVLPIIEYENDIEIDEKLLKEYISRAGGHGGQNVNKRETAVKLVYEHPDGEQIIINSSDERTQLANKKKAYERLRKILLEKQISKKLNEFFEQKKQQIGKGLRSEKIRTYQFQNGIISDKRTDKKFPLEKIFNYGNYNLIHEEIIKNLFIL